MELREKVANLPAQPGVYLFQDAAGKILYVGKARSLRSRVRSYFLESSWQRRQDRVAGSRNRRPRLHRRRQRERGARARKQPHQAVQAEIQYPAARRQDLSVHPLHGVREISARLRDAAPDKGRLDLFRAVLSGEPGLPAGASDPQAFSGAVVHGGSRRAVIRGPCLQYYIHRCLGPCAAGLVTDERYAEAARDVRLFLEGRRNDLSRSLKRAHGEGVRRAALRGSRGLSRSPAHASRKWRSARKSPRRRATTRTCSPGTPSRRKWP